MTDIQESTQSIQNINFDRQGSLSIVYGLIEKNKLISRSKLVKLSELAPASITKLTRQLIQSNLINEMALQESTGGRPAISLTCRSKNFIFLSAKLGRCNLTLSSHYISGNKIIEFIYPLEEIDDVIEFLISKISDLIEETKKEIDVDHKLIAIAVTTPGLIDQLSGSIIYSPKHKIKNLPLAKILKDKFNVETYIANYTQALSLAELYFGAAKDCQDSVLITVHDGVGAGIINDSKIFTNFNNQVGEIGHIKIEPLGLPCHCGNHGCLETLVSNGAIIKQVENLIKQGHPTSLDLDKLSIETICAHANKGDELAILVLKKVGKILGQSLALIVNLFNPQKILIKGKIVNSKELLFPVIEQSVKQNGLQSFTTNFSVTEALFQDEPSMAGVALVRRALFQGELLNNLVAKDKNNL